jgi:hypothetical protein
VTLSALPCGVTEEDKPCQSTAGVPRGVQCWENSGGGSGIGARETKWIDARSCTIGSLVLTTARGMANASFSIPELPPGVKRNAKLQAALTAALVPPPLDPKNPRHGIAHLKSQPPKVGDTITRVPQEPWWPGPIPKQANSSTSTTEPFDDNGECPCSLRFDAERFDKVREWKLGEQTLSMWAYLRLGRGELAFAVTDPAATRHRWIHSFHGGVEPHTHVEGTRWYATASDGTGEGFFLLGYDARTGEAWRLELDYRTTAEIVDGGVVLTRDDKSAMRPWSSFAPR